MVVIVKSIEKTAVEIRRWRKENWRHMFVRTDCMVISYHGKEAGVSFQLILST